VYFSNVECCADDGILLQSAAQRLTPHCSAVQYSAEVGVNSYVRIMLSFLQKEVRVVVFFVCVCANLQIM